ncbi:hypothetical protein SLA2020_510630 [Shorea laevis]
MAKPSPSIPFLQQTQTLSSSSSSSSSETIVKDLPPEMAAAVAGFFESVGVSDPDIDNYNSIDLYSNLLCGHLKAQKIERGRLTCLVSVKPALGNYFGGTHGGAVGAIAERVSIATARTVVAQDKELFLGELSISYLSAAPINSELLVDGFVVRSGRNLTVVSMDFKMKETKKLVYTARATFYNSPIAKL